MFKKCALSVLVLALLSGCGSSPPPVSTISYKPPPDCNETTVLAALPSELTNAIYIPTQWQPADGTDLTVILDGGGIACTYGVQQAEIGATVSWVEDTNGLFDSRIAGWKGQGFEETSLPGVTADRIFVITAAAMNAREIHSWSANLLVKGNWIQVSASYVYKNSEATQLVNAAISSLRS
jgi:hypothetical protein